MFQSGALFDLRTNNKGYFLTNELLSFIGLKKVGANAPTLKRANRFSLL